MSDQGWAQAARGIKERERNDGIKKGKGMTSYWDVVDVVVDALFGSQVATWARWTDKARERG